MDFRFWFWFLIRVTSMPTNCSYKLCIPSSLTRALWFVFVAVFWLFLTVFEAVSCNINHPLFVTGFRLITWPDSQWSCDQVEGEIFSWDLCGGLDVMNKREEGDWRLITVGDCFNMTTQSWLDHLPDLLLEGCNSCNHNVYRFFSAENEIVCQWNDFVWSREF